MAATPTRLFQRVSFTRFHHRVWPPSAKPRDMRAIKTHPAPWRSVAHSALKRARCQHPPAPEYHQSCAAIGRAPPPCSARRRTSLAAQSEERGRTRRAAIGRGGAQSVARTLHRSCGEPASWRNTRRAPSSRITALSWERRRIDARALNNQDSARSPKRRPKTNIQSVGRCAPWSNARRPSQPGTQMRCRVAMADALRTANGFAPRG